MAKIKSLAACSFCNKEVYRLAGQGLCATCYQRKRKNGTPDYVKVRKPCSIEGCENLSVAHGYCEMHYKRWRIHGIAEGERFEKWGQSSTHPLYASWDWMKRTQTPKVDAWKDFWVFVRDVGDRPTPKHKLQRADRNQPFGPGNAIWQPPLEIDASVTQDRNEYARLYRASRNFQEVRKYDLKKLYGLGPGEYEKMLAEQNGVCAICKEPETTVQKTGRIRAMAVDHDHATGELRALLCGHCNRGLGAFRDDPILLEKAAAYLHRYKSPPR